MEEEIIDAAASTLIEAIAAQRKLTLVIAAFFGRLSARVTRARREATALAHVEATRKAAAVALAKLHEPAHVGDLLDIASAELHQAIPTLVAVAVSHPDYTRPSASSQIYCLPPRCGEQRKRSSTAHCRQRKTLSPAWRTARPQT